MPMSPNLMLPDASRSRSLLHEVLTGSFSYDHYRMIPSFNPLLQSFKKSIKGKGNLRNEAEVHVAVHKNRIGSDETLSHGP